MDICYALLLNESIPRAYRGKKLCLENILKFPSKSEGIRGWSPKFETTKLQFYNHFYSIFVGMLEIRKWGHYLLQVLQVIPSDLEGNFSIFFRRSFVPFNALGMPSFNNSVHKKWYILKWVAFELKVRQKITSV